MAKPHFDDAGSSCHIHSSLWSPTASTSLMAGDGEHHMSDVFRWYLGGLMATAAEFALLVAPTVNSYKRFQPGSWAPTGIGWASTTARSGSASSATARRCGVENRIPGADANTYHAFAATIAGGLHGIANRIEPPRAVRRQRLHRRPTCRASRRRSSRRSSCGAAATIARECFGDDVHHHVLHFAESELAAFNPTVTDWERRRYFERI